VPPNHRGVDVTNPTIRRCGTEEINAVGASIALSFNDLPPSAYLVPPLTDRRRVVGDYFTLYAEHALENGRIDVIEHGGELFAAAVWFDRTRGVPEPDDYDRRLTAMAGKYLDRFKLWTCCSTSATR
jgi:hypothetical protein